jgi:DNA-binding transcriptional MerR regulator
MGYTAAQVKEIAVKLRAMPVVESPPKDLTKQEVVKMLAKEIKSLQNKGYTLEQIATSLKGEGLDISTPTLKSYLQRLKSKPKAVDKKKVASNTESNSIEVGSKVDERVDNRGDGEIDNLSGKSKGGNSKLTPKPDSSEL